MTEFGTVTQMGRSIYWRGQPRRHRKGAAAAYSSWRSSVKFYAEGITDLCCVPQKQKVTKQGIII